MVKGFTPRFRQDFQQVMDSLFFVILNRAGWSRTIVKLAETVEWRQEGRLRIRKGES